MGRLQLRRQVDDRNTTRTVIAYADAFTTTPQLTHTQSNGTTPQFTGMATATLTITPPLTISPTPTIGIVATQVSSQDGMVLVYIPAGEFMMGASDYDLNATNDEKPRHKVFLDAFWIDRTEVTNTQYVLCVNAGACRGPLSYRSYNRSNYYDDPQYANFPVIDISWDDANSYCKWADRRLPSEAEWEKAARGTDGRIYPWGANIDCTKANYQNCTGDTTMVGNYPSGASPYGALDMAGNVWEWVSSVYKTYPYIAGDGRENLSSRETRVLRGGAWGNQASDVRAALRYDMNPNYRIYHTGFRCAR